MKALILASGAGKRLRPITFVTPKSLIMVKNKQVLKHLLEKLNKSKYIDEIYIVYDHNFEDQFKSFMEDFKIYLKCGKRIELISDREKNTKTMPGSIGTINFFVKLKKIREDLLILASDSLFDFNIDNFIEFAKKHGKTSVAVYDLKRREKAAKKYGVVEIGEKNKIIGFEEKPSKPKTSLVATLCYMLSNYDLHHLDKKVFRENAGELIAHLVDHEDVYAYVFGGKWCDIGSLEDLERAKKEF